MSRNVCNRFRINIHSKYDFDSVIDTCGTIGPCPGSNWQWIDGSSWDYEYWGSFADIKQGQG